MEFLVRPHEGGQLYRFNEDTQFQRPVQPSCVFVSGGLAFRLPRVQDPSKLYQDITNEDTSSVLWYSRTGTQAEQAAAVLEVIIPDLLQLNIRNATIILALEEQHLKDLDWEDTFPLLVRTLEKVEVINRRENTEYDLVGAQMLLPIGEGLKPLQAAVVANNAAVAAFNFHIRGARTLELWRFAVNRKARQDSALKIAVEGLEHIALAPSNYESARIPSASCMLRMRKSIRTYLRVGVRNESQLKAPYRIRGKESIVYSPPVATDKDGVLINPRVAVQHRVQELAQGVPIEDLSPIPRIVNSEFIFVAVEGPQVKVDRRREALKMSRNRSPVAGCSRRTEDTSSSRSRPAEPRGTSHSKRTASCRPPSTHSSRRSSTSTRRSPPRRSPPRRSPSPRPGPSKKVTFHVTHSNPAERRMREMRVQSEMERVRRLREEIKEQKSQKARQIKDLRDHLTKQAVESGNKDNLSSRGASAAGNQDPVQDAKAKVKKLLDLAANLQKQRAERLQEKEKNRIKAELRRRTEARREQIEAKAKESREAAAIRRSMKIIHDTWSSDLKVRQCRRDLLVRLAVESTDEEDRDQTSEYIWLSKATKILNRNPEELAGLPSVQISSESSSSDSNSSSSSSSSEDEKDKKGEKRKRSSKKRKAAEKKKKRD